MEKIGATPLEHGDIAYEFEVIDGFRVQMILWAGDDEFPPSSQILFSDNFPIAFQAEDMAVVGDISITMIKALAYTFQISSPFPIESICYFLLIFSFQIKLSKLFFF